MIEERPYDYWHLTSLSPFLLDFQKLVNIGTLKPLLTRNKVINMSDLAKLNRLYNEPRSIQVDHLVEILGTKGRDGVCGLIESLKEDQEHSGHWELASILNHAYGKHMYCTIISYVISIIYCIE